ncbi:MAG: hypothetical protein ACLUDG_00010 [Butyricicoccus sp.]
MNSFQYFQLKKDEKLTNPIQIFRFTVEGEYTGGKVIDPRIVPKHQVAYFEYSPQVELCHVLFQPTLLVENSIKRPWHLYEPRIKYKGVQVFANDTQINVSPMYWCPVLDSIDCMDKQTELYPDGKLKNLVIHFKAIQGRHIIQVAGLLEPTVLVSLQVAESMLKRSAIGFELQEVMLV